MALQSPFFNKRDSDPYTQPRTQGQGQNSTGSSPSGAASASASVAAPSMPAANTVPAKEGESKLTVGPNIKLKGVEITDCDTLVVEGSVEATMDSRVIQISERGSFKGSADIDIAEIRGHFEGNLNARQKLVIYSTGKVTGKVHYGKIVIEEGGQLSGDVDVGAEKPRVAATPVRTGVQNMLTAAG
ncbi:polymer-forming cytoskeletal protein [Caenimonas koreensis]|uniref:Polymer-forming cytoskeletal protein n=1 Tax=Caenimonas koreensis DSM 17982 TaxID=1121255 RepID=A0A844AYQ5_9BURK|nr:polymer-forming cytoskeletal protein [Caenimonas koreensis]MRD45913.1 polymer-forming cytoskeletal protein [Caenimonas koreensis DSM 17982]